jgi:hypothetical protein
MRLLIWLFTTLLMALPVAKAETRIAFATQPGRPALDGGAGVGNPFATALLASLARGDTDLRDLLPGLAKATWTASGGNQSADLRSLVEAPELQRWRLHVAAEPRVALVLAYAEYPAELGAPSLPGASFDAERLAAALETAGWRTTLALNPSRAELPDLLQRFAAASSAAEAALLYTTGHGLELAGETLLLPTDFPVAQGRAALGSHALPLGRLAAAMQARRVNLLFYGGCRDDPFAETSFRP